MLLGIEIGGTKLQFGIGTGDGPPLAALERLDVQPQHGTEGIRRQIEAVAKPLIRRYGVTRIGIGFGGPVDSARGRVIVSNQVEGWQDFPLVEWSETTLGLPTLLANDSDSAGLAEARFGGGKGHRVVFYNNYGSGIGGALVIDGRLYQGGGGVASEIGHLRPGLDAQQPDQDLESIASGWALADYARDLIQREQEKGDRSNLPERPEGGHHAEHGRAQIGPVPFFPGHPASDDLLARCEGDPGRLDTKLLAQAAEAGNRLALAVFDRACQAAGWALAQMITLLAPNVVVIGGGVSLAPEAVFLGPLRRWVDRYAFPPLLGSYRIVPAALGEEVVVHGVLALTACGPA